jgi:ATP-dependent Lon protease
LVPDQKSAETKLAISKFLDQLPRIPDEPSRAKVRREIERLEAMDRHSPEYHKVLAYLDETFSVPWDRGTVGSACYNKYYQLNGTWVMPKNC